MGERRSERGRFREGNDVTECVFFFFPDLSVQALTDCVFTLKVWNRYESIDPESSSMASLEWVKPTSARPSCITSKASTSRVWILEP
jgi:hypothetical protein